MFKSIYVFKDIYIYVYFFFKVNIQTRFFRLWNCLVSHCYWYSPCVKELAKISCSHLFPASILQSVLLLPCLHAISVKSTFLKIPRIYDIMCGFPVSALFHLTWWSKFPFTLLWQVRYSTVCKPHGLYPSSRPGAPTCLPFCDCWPLSHCIPSVKSMDLSSKSWLHLL